MDEKTKGSSARGTAARRPMSPAKKAALFTILGVLALSVVARVVLGGGGETAQPASANGAAQAQPDSFLPGGTKPPQGAGPQPAATAEPEGLEKALPYITEGSFFAVIGFALGYASKKFLKVGLIVLAFFFVGLQVLSFTGVVTIDWSRAVSLLNEFVLNVKQDQTFTQVLTARLPSAGALLGAYAIGFRSG